LKKKRRVQKKKRPYLLIGLAGLFIVGAIVLLLLDTQEAQAPTGLLTRTSEVERVTLTDAVEAFNTGSAVFLDVRTQGEYAASRIPGAISIPINQLPDRLNELDPDDWIITYCT
jgi:3-mercaptopyruvate sulfurtransferase SseA